MSVMLLVHDAIKEKDIPKRIEKLRQLTQSHPESSVAHGVLASELHRDKGSTDEIESHYQKALAADPNDASILCNYAVFFMNQRKDNERAEECYQKALAADSNNANNLGNYANFLKTQRKDNNRAEEYYQKALAASPNHANNLCNYAIFLANHRKDIERAEEYYQKALAADPNHANNIGNYAEFVLLHQTLSKAAAHLARAARCESMKDPAGTDSISAFLWMGLVVAEKEGKPFGAILGALKTILSTPGYAPTFRYGALIAWVEKNIQPPGAAAFWIAVARVCEGTETSESLEQFPRWRDTKPVPIEEGLSAISTL
jgi:tetratricopeptide (TPR) repeat protein